MQKIGVPESSTDVIDRVVDLASVLEVEVSANDISIVDQEAKSTSYDCSFLPESYKGKYVKKQDKSGKVRQSEER